MANLFQLDTVKYICCCGSLKPICNVYFCRHCLRLRCPYCVSHEVDSLYCGNCSENMPSAEAKAKKNRCGTCYDCPSCKMTLSTRATTIHVPSEEEPEKMVGKKLYYLACGFCRWTSRDAALPDSQSTTGPWQEPENSPEAKQQLFDTGKYFADLAEREKNSKEKKFVHKSKYLAVGRHGLAHLLPKRFPIATADEMAKAIPPPTYVAPTEGDEELQEFTDEFYDQEFVVAKVTNLQQRLHQLEIQSPESSSLLPMHKPLLVKRSLRCRVCERNISKPEYSPVSIKFKIQLNAYYHVPQVRLMNPLPNPLLPGQSIRIVLRLSNPTQFPTSIKFLPFSFTPLKKSDNASDIPGDLQNWTKPADPTRESSTDASLPSNLTTPSTSLTILPAGAVVPSGGGDTAASYLSKEVHVLPIRNEKFIQNCRLVSAPEAEVILPPRDETSDFDEFSDTPDFNDDPSLVPWRKANKAAVCLDVVRFETTESSSDDDPPVLGLTIEYDYVNTIVALESKMAQGPQKVRLQAHLLIALNKSFQQ